MPADLREIPLSTAITNLGEHTLVDFGEQVGRGVLSKLKASGAGLRLRLVVAGWDRTIRGVDDQRTVGDIAAFARQAVPRRAFALEGGRPLTSTWLLRPRSQVLFLLLLAMAAAALVLGPVAISPLAPGTTGIVLGTIVAGVGVALPIGYALTQRTDAYLQIDDEQVELGTLALPEGLREIASRQVLKVKEEYGRLLSDLAYRIEHPVLFDAATPVTEELTLALFEWDQTTEQLSDEDRSKLAARVVRAFNDARAQAERIGMNHIPERHRADAARALKAARLASDPRTTPTERNAALASAVDILTRIALYYLPTPDEAREIAGGRQLKQLPGRRPQ